MDDNLKQRVDDIAKSLHRHRAWIIAQAQERFMMYEDWYIQEVQAGLAEVEREEIASEAEVANAFKKWDVNAGQMDAPDTGLSQ